MKINLLWLVLALQSAFLLGTAAVHEFHRETGAVILLETFPVDPRDLLRGDYLSLRYPIGSLESSNLVRPLPEYRPGSPVFVLLEKEGEFYVAKTASPTRPVPTESQIMVKGRCAPTTDPARLHINYGIERYYVPEGKGNPQGKLSAEVSVNGAGAAQLRQIYVNGAPYPEPARK